MKKLPHMRNGDSISLRILQTILMISLRLMSGLQLTGLQNSQDMTSSFMTNHPHFLTSDSHWSLVYSWPTNYPLQTGSVDQKRKSAKCTAFKYTVPVVASAYV